MRARGAVLPAMAAILAVYVAMHSPLLPRIGRVVGQRGDTCYFACAGWQPAVWTADSASATLCLLLAVWAAWRLAPQVADAGERALAFGLMSLALIVLPASWIGLVAWAVGTRWLEPPFGPVLTAIPSVLVLAAGRKQERHRASAPVSRSAWPRLVLVLAAMAVALLAGSAAVSLARPPTGYDALSYHGPLAVYYWRDGNLGSYLERQPWAWALAHPGSAELLFGILRLAAGERIASLGQLPFALLGAVAVHILGRRSGLPVSPAALGALAFLVAPIVVVQSGMQLNDLAAGALVLTAIALAAAPMPLWSTRRLCLLGLALGLAVTTKLAVLPAALGVLGYVALRLPRAEQPGRSAMYGLLALLAVAGPWWLRNAVLFGNPIYPAALPILGRGYVVGDFVQKDRWFVPTRWAWPVYPVIESHGEMSGFGALFAVAALPGVLNAAVRARRGPIALLGIVTVVSLPAWWQLSQHEPRLLLGVLGAGFLGIGWALMAVPRRRRRLAAWLVATAAVFSAAVTVDQAILPRLDTPSPRALFYEMEWGIDSTVASLPDAEGLVYHTGYAYRSYAGDYPLLGARQNRVLTVIDGVLPSDSVVRLMRAQRIRYAYVPAMLTSIDTVLGMYPPAHFNVVHRSTISRGGWKQTTRFLFYLKESRR